MMLCAAAFLTWAGGAVAADGRDRLEVPYVVRFTGAPSWQVRGQIRKASRTFGLRDRPPATYTSLQRRAETDVPILLNVLRHQGFYQADMAVSMATNRRPAKVRFTIQPGAQYRIGSVQFNVAAAGQVSIRLPKPELRRGQRALGEAILRQEQSVLQSLRRQGYPFARLKPRDILVDHALRKLDITYEFDAGPKGVFGEVEIRGLRDVPEALARRHVFWDRGATYDPELVTDFEDRLYRTGLFSLVRILPGEGVDEDGSVPIVAELRERRPRTLRFGGEWASDTGWGGSASWEHRNLLRHGKQISFSGSLSETRAVVDAGFGWPLFLRPDQSLSLDIAVQDDYPEAYSSRSMQGSATLHRRLSRRLEAAAGVAYKWSIVEQLDSSETFGLLSLPSSLQWDSRNNLLDPRRGVWAAGRVAPYADMPDLGLFFVRSMVEGRHYARLISRPEVVLASRASVGSLGGAGRDAIPADERFYAGGGGSIRGYEYQTVGPLVDGDPVGGASLLELSIELRARASRQFGLVAFADGGNVYESAWPDGGEPLRWGAGGGLRYYTGVGPLRLDGAVPLDPREGIDKSFMLYISFGQSF